MQDGSGRGNEPFADRGAEALAFRLGDTMSHTWYLCNAACLHFLRRDFKRVLELTSEGIDHAREAEIEQLISGLCLLGGGARVMLGDVKRGKPDLDEGMALRRKHGLGPVTSWMAELFCISHLEMGNAKEAERIVRFGIDHAEASGCGPSHSELHRHLGRILEDRGDLSGARHEYKRAISIADKQGAGALAKRAAETLLSLYERTGQSGTDVVELGLRLTDEFGASDTDRETS